MATLDTQQGATGMEYTQHLAQWKQAFALYSGAQPQSQSGVAQADGNKGSGNPYAAVLTGLQSLLEGPLFKAADGEAGLSPGGEQPTAEAAAAADAGVPSPAARSPSSRRPRKRQAGSPQAEAAAEEEQGSPAPPAAPVPLPPAPTAAARQPAAKKRRNTQSTTPAPRTSSLQDLAALAAAVADEQYDDPVLSDQQLQQDQQGGLATYASGSLANGQADGTAASGRGTRGSSGRGRQRTPAPSSSGADEGDSLGVSFPMVNEDGKPLTKQQIKRLRRQQSNRESARRSRQRKAEEANMLARRVGELEVTCGALTAKNTSLLAEVQQLRGIVEMMAGDGAALAAQVAELGGDVAPEIMTNINWLVAARATLSATQAGAAAQLPGVSEA